MKRANVPEGQRKSLVRFWRNCSVRELRIVPFSRSGVFPHRSTFLSRIFNDDAQSHLTRFFKRGPQNPYSEGKDLDRPRMWHWIAIHCDDFECVPGQCKNNILCRAGVQQSKEHALALFYANRLTCAKHLRIDRGILVSNI